jgi:hypothetical protein
MSQEVVRFITGSAVALVISLALTLLRHRGSISERLFQAAIVLIMAPVNPFLLFGKTLGLGYATATGLYYLVLQTGWLITLIVILGDLGWVLVGFAVGLYISAILLSWEFFFNEEW